MNSIDSKTTKSARATKGDSAQLRCGSDFAEVPPEQTQTGQQALPLTPGGKDLPRGLLVPFYKCIQRQARKIDKTTGKPRGYSVVWLATFAKWFCRSVKTIQVWIAELVACGWLEKQNNPGKKDMFLYPLLDEIPPLEAWSPTPTRPFLCQKTSQVSSRVTSPNTSYKGSYGAFSPSGCNQVKQQQGRSAAGVPFDPAKAYASDPIKARAAADLLACGFWERGIPGLLSVIEPELVIDACAIARWRKNKGEEIGGTGPGEGLGGYVKRLATHLKTGEWQAPRAWLKAVGRVKDEPSTTEAAGTTGTDSGPTLPSGCPERFRGYLSITEEWDKATGKHLRGAGIPSHLWPNLMERAMGHLAKTLGPKYCYSPDTLCDFMAKAHGFDLKKRFETGANREQPPADAARRGDAAGTADA